MSGTCITTKAVPLPWRMLGGWLDQQGEHETVAPGKPWVGPKEEVHPTRAYGIVWGPWHTLKASDSPLKQDPGLIQRVHQLMLNAPYLQGAIRAEFWQSQVQQREPSADALRETYIAADIAASADPDPHGRAAGLLGWPAVDNQRRLKWGLVGACRTGAAIVNLLAPKELIAMLLIDHDAIEPGNLDAGLRAASFEPRVESSPINQSSGDSDHFLEFGPAAELGEKKVEVMARRFRALCPHTQVRTLACNVLDAYALSVLAECDSSSLRSTTMFPGLRVNKLLRQITAFTWI